MSVTGCISLRGVCPSVCPSCCIRVHRQLVTVFGFKPPPVARWPVPPTKASSVPEGAKHDRLACSVIERALSEQDFILVDVTPSPSSAEATTHDSPPVGGSGAATPTS